MSAADSEAQVGPSAQDNSGEPLACTACRGSGQVISNLGGTPSQLPCPWCEGAGVRLPDHDAQLAQREAGAEDAVPAANTDPGA